MVGAVSLAGVVDLEAAARHDVGRGAVEALLGGGPDVVPERYRLALAGGAPAPGHAPAPPARVGGRLGAGLSLSELLRRRRTVARGDGAVYVPLPGVGHMEMISGRGAPFRVLATWFDAVFGPSQPVPESRCGAPAWTL